VQEVSPFEKQIIRDLARTFPDQSFFKERNGTGQESLLNVLKVRKPFHCIHGIAVIHVLYISIFIATVWYYGCSGGE